MLNSTLLHTCRHVHTIVLTHETHLLHARLHHVHPQEALLRVEISRDGHRLSGQGALPLIVLDVLLVPIKSWLVCEHTDLTYATHV